MRIIKSFFYFCQCWPFPRQFFDKIPRKFGLSIFIIWKVWLVRAGVLGTSNSLLHQSFLLPWPRHGLLGLKSPLDFLSNQRKSSKINKSRFYSSNREPNHWNFNLLLVDYRYKITKLIKIFACVIIKDGSTQFRTLRFWWVSINILYHLMLQLRSGSQEP